MMKDRLRWGDPMAHLVKVFISHFSCFSHNFTGKRSDAGVIMQIFKKN